MSRMAKVIVLMEGSCTLGRSKGLRDIGFMTNSLLSYLSVLSLKLEGIGMIGHTVLLAWLDSQWDSQHFIIEHHEHHQHLVACDG